MAPRIVVEFLKTKQLSLQVTSNPKGHVVKVLSPDRADKPFHEGVLDRYVGHRLYFGYLKYSKISLPPMEPEQRIIIAADVSRRSSPTDRTVKHPTERRSIDGPNLYAEANNLARELIHDDEHPMALENEGFAAEQIDAP